MTDISDSTAGIFSTDDSLGFKIVQEGEMPATELPSPLPSVPLGLNQEISSGEIPGLDNSLIPELPALLISERINVVLYDQAIYPDTTDYTIDTTIVIGTDPLTGDDITVDTTIFIADVTPFSFPTTETKFIFFEKKLAEWQMYVAAPPIILSVFANGVSIASKATVPTTKRLIKIF